MLPYYNFEIIKIGPLTLHVWGLFVALGVIVAIIFGGKLARKQKLSEEIMFDSAIFMLVGAFLMARVFHVAVYEPTYYLAHLLDIFKIWQGGASSTGGFIGAFLGLFIYIKKRHLTKKDLYPYFDIMAVSLWLGWGIGRIGCFLTHEHPGKLTDFFMGVQYPGGSRFDLGLFESLVGFLLFAVYFSLFNYFYKKGSGLVAGYSFITYAIIRFFLDFLRASPQDYMGGDIRYFMLTPAQWAMLALIIIFGVMIKIRLKEK